MTAALAPAAGRDRLIDALRGTAALVVVLHHLNAIRYFGLENSVPVWGAITAYGYLGVPVFFVVSGYCIGQAWSKAAGPVTFFRRRFWRIYPAYAASVVMILGGVFLWKRFHGVNDITPLPASPAHWLATVALVTNPATNFTTVNWVYWSLTNEVFYYLVLGLLLLVPAARRGTALLAVHAGLCLLELTAGNLHGTPLFFIDHWDVFALGVGACLVVARRPEAPWFLGLSAVHLAAQAVQGRSGLYEAVGLATLGLVLYHRPMDRFPLLRPLAAVGRISYSLYLVHVPVGVYVFMRLVGPKLEGSVVRFAASQVAGVALVLGAAVLFHRFFERPFLNRKPATPA